MPDVVIGGSQNQEGQVSVAVDGQVLGSSSCQRVTYDDLEPDIYLDQDNRIIAIADKTFGNKGIQLDWNAGFPRIYVGDGSANYFKYDGSKVFLETATVDLDGDTGTLTLSGNLVCDEVQANKFMWGGTYIQIVVDDIHDYIILGDSAEIILDGPNEMISVGTASKIVLDGTNQQIYINDATFGNQGIQLDYNAGTPRVYIGDGANQYFKFDGTNISWKGTNTELTAAGAFTATSATITGTITATAGAIGGWDIAATTLSSGTTNIVLDSGNKKIYINSGTFGNKGIQLDYNAGTPRAYIGDGANAYVNFDGTKLTWKAANTELDANGKLTCTAGWIGGWVIAATTLKSASSTIELDSANETVTVGNIAADGIRISSTGIALYDDGTQKGAWLVDSTWWLGSNSSNKKLEWNPSTTTFYVRGNAAFDTLVFQERVTTRGSVLVTLSAGELFEATTATGTTFTVKVTKPPNGAAPLANGDICLLDDGINSTWFTVGAASDQTYYYQYTATYQSGSNSDTYQAGTAIADYGQSGDGGLLLTADESDAPYLTIFDHAGAPWTTINYRLRLGNLNNFLDYTSDAYGIAIGDTTSYLAYDVTQGLRVRGTITADSLPILPPDEDLAAYWPLDDGSGVLATDRSGNGYDATFNKAVTWGPGIAAGQCVTLGDQTTYAEVPHSDLYGYVGDFTLTAWVYLDDTYPDGTTNWTIMETETYPNTGWMWRIGGSTGRPYFRTNNGTGVGGSADTAIGNNTLRFLAVTWDNATLTYTFYIDGEEDGSGTLAHTYAAGTFMRLSYSSQGFQGSLDEMRFYKKVLTAREIKALYLYPAGTAKSLDSYLKFPSDSDLLVFWNFDAGDGSIVLDASGHGIHGTFINTPTWGTGVSAGAMDFGGTAAVNNDTLSPDGDLTLSFWLKLTSHVNWASGGSLYYHATPAYGMGCTTHGGTYLRVYAGDGLAAYTYTDWTYSFSLDTWYHIVLTYDSSETEVAAYINGVQQPGVWSKSIDWTGCGVAAGRWATNYDGYYLDGRSDELRVYQRLLTPQEIKALYYFPDGPKVTRISGYGITTGAIQSTNWGPGAGTSLDLDAATFKLGGSASPKLAWDGSNLTVVGSITITGGSGLANLSDTLDDLADGAIYVKATQAQLDAADQAGDWQAVGDTTKIDGGKIYTGSITADKIDVSSLSALAADLGTVTAGVLSAVTVIGATIQTATSGKRIEMTSDGIALVVAGTQQYGEFLYGEGYYGSGALAYIHHSSKGVPFYIDAEQTVADFHFYNRSVDPTGAAEIADVCVVDGALKICTGAGTPGTWEYVGSPTSIHTDETGEISGLTAKTSIVDDDLFIIEDSAASYAKKKVTFQTLKGEILPTGYISEYTLRSYTIEILAIRNLIIHINDGTDDYFLEQSAEWIYRDITDDDLDTDTFHWVYVDLPASGNDITSADIEISTTAPEWVQAKKGWYKTGDGTQRCIGEFLTKGWDIGESAHEAEDQSPAKLLPLAVNGSISIDTVNKKFDAALDLPGSVSADYPYWGWPCDADQIGWVGSGDNWTLAMWVYFDAHSGVQDGLFSMYYASRWAGLYYAGGELYFTVYQSGDLMRLYGGSLSTGQWYHLAVCKVGTEWGIYVDGVQQDYDNSYDSALHHASDYFYLYLGYLNGYTFNGRLESAIVEHGNNTFGAAPNSTPDDSFTVPTDRHEITDYTRFYVGPVVSAHGCMLPFDRVGAWTRHYPRVIYANETMYDYHFETFDLPDICPVGYGVDAIEIAAGSHSNSYGLTQDISGHQNRHTVKSFQSYWSHGAVNQMNLWNTVYATISLDHRNQLMVRANNASASYAGQDAWLISYRAQR